MVECKNCSNKHDDAIMATYEAQGPFKYDNTQTSQYISHRDDETFDPKTVELQDVVEHRWTVTNYRKMPQDEMLRIAEDEVTKLSNEYGLTPLVVVGTGGLLEGGDEPGCIGKYHRDCGGGPVISFSPTISSESELRQTIDHEYAHLLQDCSEDSFNMSSGERERQAMHFAIRRTPLVTKSVAKGIEDAMDW